MNLFFSIPKRVTRQICFNVICQAADLELSEVVFLGDFVAEKFG